MPDAEPVSFETHVKPMFRERDRESMEFAFDLWSRDEVSEHADAILARPQAGMPCDGAWPQAQVDLVERWVVSGEHREFAWFIDEFGSAHDSSGSVRLTLADSDGARRRVEFGDRLANPIHVV